MEPGSDSFGVAGIPLHPLEKIADPSGPTGMMSVNKSQMVLSGIESELNKDSHQFIQPKGGRID